MAGRVKGWGRCARCGEPGRVQTSLVKKYRTHQGGCPPRTALSVLEEIETDDLHPDTFALLTEAMDLLSEE